MRKPKPSLPMNIMFVTRRHICHERATSVGHHESHDSDDVSVASNFLKTCSCSSAMLTGLTSPKLPARVTITTLAKCHRVTGGNARNHCSTLFPATMCVDKIELRIQQQQRSLGPAIAELRITRCTATRRLG